MSQWTRDKRRVNKLLNRHGLDVLLNLIAARYKDLQRQNKEPWKRKRIEEVLGAITACRDEIDTAAKSLWLDMDLTAV